MLLAGFQDREAEYKELATMHPRGSTGNGGSVVRHLNESGSRAYLPVFGIYIYIDFDSASGIC